MTAQNALEVHDVVVDFGGVTALDHVSMSVAAGSRHVMFGPNGAGKTTLFNVLAGVIAPTSGRVLVHGEDAHGLRPFQRARRGLGRTFQITTLMQSMTVRENVTLAMMAQSPARWNLLRPLKASPAYSEAASLLEKWGFLAEKDRIVSELPYGAQRQLEILLALAGDHRTLLLDEPTAGLSAVDQRHMATLIEELGDEVTVVLIDHDIDLAMALATHVTVLADGHLVGDGAPDSEQVRDAMSAVYG